MHIFKKILVLLALAINVETSLTAAPIVNTITGNVFIDITLTDNTVNGTGYTGGGLFAVLYSNTNSQVVNYTTVDGSGTYTLFTPAVADYTVYITTIAPTVLQAAIPTLSLSKGLINSGEHIGTGAGNDGSANGALSLGTVNADIINANFGITTAGYIYLHSKTLDESSAVDFTFNLTGGITPASSFALNDKPNQIEIQDIGAAQKGRLWAIDTLGNVYYRDMGTTAWVATSFLNSTDSAKRIDGGQNNTAYILSTDNKIWMYDGTTKTQIGAAISNANDIGANWSGTVFVTANGVLRYSTGGAFSIIASGTISDASRVDGDPVTGNAVIARYTDDHAYIVTTAGILTDLGMPLNTTGANAHDIAVDDAGVVYTCFDDASFGRVVYMHTSGTSWSTGEATCRDYAQYITGGLGGQVWGVNQTVVTIGAHNIFTRSTDGTNIYWVDDERIRTTVTNGNSQMIAVVPGTYTVTQTVPVGWDLQNIFIYDPTNNSSFNIVGHTATLSVAAGETVHAIVQDGLVNTSTMTTDCSVTYIENFGTGALNSYGAPLTGQTSYHYLSTLKDASDNYYKVVGNGQRLGSSYIGANFADHTSGDFMGRMMAVNAAYDKNEFFRRRFVGLVPGVSYNFSAWIASLNGFPIKPNVSFMVVNPTDFSVLASTSTGNITAVRTWAKYGFTFTATTTSIDLILQNNTIGGSGNDLALDDITFSMTPPDNLTTTVVTPGCNGTTGSITVNSPLGIAYEYTIDGTNWQNTTLFDDLTPGIYAVQARFVGTTGCSTTQFDTVKISICGNVFNDTDGLSDGIVNGTGTNAGGVNAVLYDSTIKKIIAITPVAANGSYELIGLPGDSLTVFITTSTPLIGTNTLPVIALPAGWVNTDEYHGTGIGNDGTTNSVLPLGIVNNSTTNVNFGIEQPPFAGNGENNGGTNPKGTTQVTVPANTFTNITLSTDSTLVTAIRITAFPTGATTIVVNSISYDNGSFPVNGIIIHTDRDGNPAQSITVDPISDNTTSVTISFVALDSAGIQSSNTGTAVITLTNNFPLADADNAATSVNTPVTISMQTNDTFGADGAGTITILQQPDFGTATIDNAGTPGSLLDDQIIYTPFHNYNGNDSLIYQICDSNGDCDTAVVYIVISYVLPVNITSFSANRQGQELNLHWDVATETNINHYEIERSTSGNEYTSIDNIVKNNIATGYNYTDKFVTEGIYYYRLKIVDNNGAITYSKTITINFNDKAIIVSSIYPTPFNDIVFVNLELIKKSSVIINLFDAVGRNVYQQIYKGNTGLNKLTISGLSQLSAGMYMFKVVTENGVTQQMILKVKR